MARAQERPVRMVVVWCRDWPVVALDLPVGEPVAIVRANRVEATSASARVAGVVEGLRRREAQRRCPEVRIVERDVDREARAFERVVTTIDDITPRIEILRPGVVAFPTRGPSRYFGGDDALAIQLHDLVGAQLADPSGCGVGLADGVFAATLAAHRGLSRPSSPPITVAEGATPGFLGPFPTKVLVSPGPVDGELVDVFGRLGLHRLADVAALDARDVLARFGYPGAVAHRLASGFDEHPPRLGPPPDDMTVSLELDPPADRVDQVAFAGKMLADRLHEALGARGLACTRIMVTAHTTGGSEVERVWRHEGALTAADVAQRIRWQLDGWLSRPGAVGRGGVCRLVLRPDEVVGDTGRQVGFWGGTTDDDERARRAIARVQGIVGTDGVVMPEHRGGRAPTEEYRLVPADLAGAAPLDLPPPWPGRLPVPHPAVVPRRTRTAEVVDDEGAVVAVSGRGALSTTPRRLSIESGPWRRITGWAGPWLYDERWWDAVGHRRRARFQVLLEDGTAHLVVLEAGRWWLEATYD
jgi:protein ImuB